MGESTDSRAVLTFDGTEEVVSPSDVTGRNVLAVLTESTTDEWHRRWDGADGPVYEQMGVVEAYDLARSASAAASAPRTHVVNDNLAVTTVQRPVEASTIGRLVEQYLDGWAESEAETLVYVESLDALFANTDLEVALETTRNIVQKANDVGATLRAKFDGDAASARATVRVRACFETVVGAPIADPDAVADLQRLRADDPTNFGYLRGNWNEALTALDASTRSYPQAKQLYEDADVPETSPQKLGAALSALERLDALALWGDTVGANRYDLTSYDPERAAVLALAVESLAE